jgi:glucan 1,3-beta-glucosidase
MFTEELMSLNQTAQLKFVCQSWGSLIATSIKAFGPTMVGEFSVAVNDCSAYLNGINAGARWDGNFGNKTYRHSPDSTCDGKNDASTYSYEYKAFLKQLFLAQLEAYEQGAGWFYWNFKTETNPLWSYFDGVEGGWLPEDANNRGPGYCTSIGYPVNLRQVVDQE